MLGRICGCLCLGVGAGVYYAAPDTSAYDGQSGSQLSIAHFRQEFPSQSCTESSAKTLAVQHCMWELDHRGPQEWEVETSDFTPSEMKNHVDRGTPCFQMLRQSTLYTSRDGVSTAPFLRLVGFFPGVTSAQVLDHVSDIDKRLTWDRNYQLFRAFPGEESCNGVNDRTTGSDDSLCRPMQRVAKRRPLCTNGECRLLPDVLSTQISKTWMCHRVGSRFLTKLGLLPRLFVYERSIWSHAPNAALESVNPNGSSLNPPPFSSSLPALYDVLYNGSRAAVTYGKEHTAGLKAWLEEPDTASVQSVAVDMNYQHLLLLPIANYQKQLVEQPEQLNALARSGSQLDTASTTRLYQVYQESLALFSHNGTSPSVADRNSHPRDLSGTLLIMTSANDAAAPQLLRFVERRAAEKILRQAYGGLMDSIVREKKGSTAASGTRG